MTDDSMQEFDERALISGTLGGSEFEKAKAFFFLKRGFDSSLGPFPLSPVIFHRPD